MAICLMYCISNLCTTFYQNRNEICQESQWNHNCIVYQRSVKYCYMSLSDIQSCQMFPILNFAFVPIYICATYTIHTSEVLGFLTTVSQCFFFCASNIVFTSVLELTKTQVFSLSEYMKVEVSSVSPTGQTIHQFFISLILQ